MNHTTNPNCHSCQGTGTDSSFGNDCTECQHDSLMAERYRGVYANASDRAYTPGERLDGRTFGGSSAAIYSTQPQRDLIQRLLSERPADCILRTANADTDLNALSRPNASAMIDNLIALAKWERENAPAPEAAEQGTRPANARDNRYDATCSLCGQLCDAGTGWIVKGDRGWITTHNTCPEAAAPAAPEAPAAELPAASEVPAGFYAIASTGDNNLAFYRIDRPTEGAYAGRVFVKLMIGGHPDSNVRYASVAGILARIAEAGADAAGQLYAAEFTRCYRCNRTLTDEASRATGLGPVCRLLD